MTQRDFASTMARTRWLPSIVPLRRDVAAAEVLGQRAADQLAIVVDRDRAARNGRFTLVVPAIGSAANVELRLLDLSQTASSRMCAAALKSCDAGIERLEALRAERRARSPP